MKIRHVEFKTGAIYDHAVSRALIRRLRLAERELLFDDELKALLTEAATWISIMTDAFMEEDEDAL